MSEFPSRGAIRPQKMMPGRAERRKETLDALKRAAVIIDLTNDDTSPSPAATRPQTMEPGMRLGPAKHRADLEVLERPPVIDLTDDDADDDDSQGWEPLAVYPTFLKLAVRNGRCTNGNGRIDLHSIAEVGLKPCSGYPVKFHLFRSRGGFTGKYGEDKTGIISLDLEEVEAMIQETTVCRYLAYVWSAE